jgi:Ca2+-binding RTX toxin-like protein
MPSFKPFDITLGDLNFLLDQMRDAIKVIGYDGAGRPIYGYTDSTGVTQTLGLFGTFDPLNVTDAVTHLPIYDGAREASGFRIPAGLFNNLVDLTRWTWGATNDPFPRLTQADYDHYVAQVLLNPALTNGAHTGYVDTHSGVANPSASTTLATPAAYADLNKSVVDYTPRMITQTISSSYGAPGVATATGIAAAASDEASVLMSPGELLIVSTAAGMVAFSFYDGASTPDPSSGNHVGIDVRPGATVAAALAAIQTALQVLGGATGAAVGIDPAGHISIALGSASEGTLAVFDYAGLGLGGTFAPAVDDSSSALIRTGVYTDVFTSTNVIDGTNPNGTLHHSDVTEYVARNLNTLPGDPSMSGIFTLFGQFFDHGLDFIDKGGQGARIIIPLAPTDPLYGAIGPDGQPTTTITISRATPDHYTVTDLHGRPLSIAGVDRVWGTGDDLNGTGSDGVYGTADDTHGAMVKPAVATYTDHTSPYIDQSQSYGSDTQITNLLREWVQDPNTDQWRPGAELLDGHHTQAYNSQVFNDASPDGLGVGTTTRTLPTLAELRAHLVATGRDDLTWDDVNNYRARDADGHVIDTNADSVGGYVYTGQALLLDMNPHVDSAHVSQAAVDALNLAAGTSINRATLSIGDLIANGFFNPANSTISAIDPAIYSAVGQILMESVADHYIAGDGRANENFALTGMHHVFHENHNVQLINLENTILTSPDVNARHGYQLAVSDGHAGFYTDVNGNYTLADHTTISWDPDKMFAATKLINEMEYQHVAIDQYARLVTPDLPEFVTYDNDINADISLEYSQAAFRFGHSQLRETIDAIDPNGNVVKWALSAAFLNPSAYAATGAENIMRGMSQQLGNDVDEFLTPALQQSLLGQPLDLGAINIARGRDLGMPTLNEVRRQLHDALVAERAADPSTPHHTNLIVDALNPYTSWAEFGSQMQHPDSLVNFVAAYSFDGDLAKAQEIMDLETGAIASMSGAMHWTTQDAVAFLNNAYTGSDFGLSGGQLGFNSIDFWIGGLAELHVFTGQVGTTFNAIFEDQMERLMDGDRFYYLYRLGVAFNIDPDLGHMVVTEQFKDIIERTTGAMHLNGDVMGYADHTFELARDATAALATAGESIHNSLGASITAAGGEQKYELDASTGNWVLITNFAEEQAYGQILARHAADPNGIDSASSHANLGLGIYSGFGNGIAGDGTLLTKSNTDLGITRTYIADFRPDIGENPDGTPATGYNSHEVIAGTDYDDWLDAGNGDDTIYGDKGDDVLDGKAGADHIYGGDGQDVIYGGDIEDFLDGGAGDDIVYAGTSAGAIDIVIGGSGNDKLYGEAGIEEMYAGAGDDYVDAGGDTDLVFGDSGNDIMYGGDGPDELRGGTGDDILSGGSGSDMLKGEWGDDIFMSGIGMAAQVGDSDESLGDIGFDIASLTDVSIVLDRAADLRNLNQVAANGGVPFQPFNQLWADIEGVIGSRFGDTIIGADSGAVDAEGVNPGDNWLVGGGGNDTFGTRVLDATGVQGSGGNDVIVGDSVRLDALIGHYSGYTEDHPELAQFDADGNAVHGLLNGDSTLIGGLLGHGQAAGFATHFTELLKTHDRKDLVLGQDPGSAGNHDVAVYTGSQADYTLTTLDANGNVVANPHANWNQVFAVKIGDNVGERTLADGTVVPSDGTDLLIGVEYLDFVDNHNFNIQAYFDIAPTLDLNYVPVQNFTVFAQDNFDGSGTSYSRGSGWNGNWTETNDTNGASGGDIQDSNNSIAFGSSIDGNETISRAVNLSGQPSARLEFDYTMSDLEAGKNIRVEAWNQSASAWQVIGSFLGSGSGVSSSGHVQFDLIAGQINANSAIRFRAEGSWSNTGGSDGFTIDNVQIGALAATFHDGDPGNNYSTSYTEQLTPAHVAATPLIADVDDPTIASARIVIRDPVAGDRLTIGSLPGGITATGNGTTTITLTGTAATTFANFQTAIAAITFSNPTNDNPTSADRHIDVTVNDGLKDSAVATTTIHVTPVDDAATLTADSVITNIGTGAFNIVIPDFALLANDSDPDGAMTISGISNGSGIAISGSGAGHSGTTTTVRDTSPAGGTFQYSVTAPGTDPSTTVTVTQDTIGALDGTASSEIIVDSATAHTINGNGGNDFVFGDGGDDTIVTGSGNDYIDGGSGADSMTGGGGNDTYVIDDASGASRDVVQENVGGGNDTIVSSNSSLNLNDSQFANVENAALAGNANLNLTGNSGDNVLTGNSGNNTIAWNALGGRDTVDGGGGTDTFVVNGNASAETYDIYAMTDGQNAGLAATLGTTFKASTEIVITRTVAGVTSVAAELDNIDEITINTLNVTANNNNGGLDGGVTGGDTVVIHGDFSNTDLNYSTITVNGSDGDDSVDISGLTSDHRIVFHGGDGNNHVVGTLRSQDVVDNETTPSGNGGDSGSAGGDQNGSDDQSQGDTSGGGDDQNCSSEDDDHQNGQGDGGTPIQPADIPALPTAQIGTAGDDVMVGTAAEDVLSGLDGDDLILGNDGADTLKAGAGDDLVKAGAGDDVVFGNEGNDIVFGGAGRDLITGDAGDDRLFGDAGDDALEGGLGNDTVYGGAGNDRVMATVGDGNDTYFGDTDEDTLDYSAISANINADLGNGIGQHGSVASAQSGTDTVFGFENFIGGSGNDTIVASSVANVMDGGGGNDTFMFGSTGDANGDTIMGFQPGDKIDLSAIDANTGAGGSQSFVLFAGNVFTSAGQVIVTHEVRDGADHTIVSGNTNGDATADFRIDVAGNQALTTADFNGVH